MLFCEGRIDQKLFVGLPNQSERLAILLLHSARTPIGEAGDAQYDVDVDRASARNTNNSPSDAHVCVMQELSCDECTGGLSGADLHHVCREAALDALSDNMAARWVSKIHYTRAVEAMRKQKQRKSDGFPRKTVSRATSQTSNATHDVPTNVTQMQPFQFCKLDVGDCFNFDFQ